MSSDNSESRYPLIPVDFSSDWNYEDHAAMFGIEMALIHNVFIRCLNSIWYHAPLVKKGDELAFAGYCLAWAELIHDHHHGEEAIVFPFLQSKFDMSHNVEQHRAFLNALNVFEEYLKQVFNKKQTYDGEKARQLVEAFGDTLVGHLHDEIPTLSPERLASYDKKELAAMVHFHVDHVKALPLMTTFPLVYTHHDFQAVPSWPQMPAPVLWITRNVAYWRHHTYWQFSPFTRYGAPQKYA